MKKLMIAAAIVCVAAMSQAASLKWSSTAYNAVDGDGNILTAVPTDATIVLAYLGSGDAASFANAKVVQSATAENWDIGNEDGEFWAQVAGSYDGKNAANGGEFANGQVYAVMLQDADGGLQQLTYADGSLDPITYEVANYSGSTWSKSFTFAKNDYVATAAIPEPTSGLLLLLGVAGLALKRRRT